MSSSGKAPARVSPPTASHGAISRQFKPGVVGRTVQRQGPADYHTVLAMPWHGISHLECQP